MQYGLPESTGMLRAHERRLMKPARGYAVCFSSSSHLASPVGVKIFFNFSNYEYRFLAFGMKSCQYGF
jgi:hypothetical protein